MMKHAKYVCFALASAPLVVRAQPSPATVSKALQSVFMVTANQCTAKGNPVKARRGTGFAATVDGSTRLVTALHVVTGCKDIKLQDQADNFFTIKTSSVLLDEDLVLLEDPVFFNKGSIPGVTPVSWSVPPLPVSTSPNLPAPGASVVVLGYGAGTPTPQSKSPMVSLTTNGNTIAGLIGSASTLLALGKQKYPSTAATVIKLQNGAPLPGDSGGPLLDDSGSVIGIANGGLKEAFGLLGWAFPSSAISRLIKSPDAMPNEATIVAELVAFDEWDGLGMTVSTPTPSVSSSSGSPPPPPPPPPAATTKTVRCGSGTFYKAATQTLKQALASADPVSLQHISSALRHAAQFNKVVSPDQVFEIWVDPSGATFSLPRGFTISPGKPCVARDPLGELEVRVQTQPTAGKDMKPWSPEAAAFDVGARRDGEFVNLNLAYTTPPTLPDATGMIFWRSAATLSVRKQFEWVINEQYATHAVRAGSYLTMLVRTLVPKPGFRQNDFFEAVVSVYMSTFR